MHIRLVFKYSPKKGHCGSCVAKREDGTEVDMRFFPIIATSEHVVAGFRPVHITERDLNDLDALATIIWAIDVSSGIVHISETSLNVKEIEIANSFSQPLTIFFHPDSTSAEIPEPVAYLKQGETGSFTPTKPPPGAKVRRRSVSYEIWLEAKYGEVFFKKGIRTEGPRREQVYPFYSSAALAVRELQGHEDAFAKGLLLTRHKHAKTFEEAIDNFLPLSWKQDAPFSITLLQQQEPIKCITIHNDAETAFAVLEQDPVRNRPPTRVAVVPAGKTRVVRPIRLLDMETAQNTADNFLKLIPLILAHVPAEQRSLVQEPANPHGYAIFALTS